MIKPWTFDRKEIHATSGAAIHWENDTYFTIEFKGRIFNGEILGHQMEDHKPIIVFLKSRSKVPWTI